jgi:hypothetical protein
VGHTWEVADAWLPHLRLQEFAGGYRLSLGGLVHGAGATSQAALDDLVARVLDLATAIQRGTLVMPREAGPPDHRCLEFLVRRHA